MAYYMFGYNVYNVADIRCANNRIFKMFDNLVMMLKIYDLTDQFKLMYPYLSLLNNSKLPLMWGTYPEYKLFNNPWFMVRK